MKTTSHFPKLFMKRKQTQWKKMQGEFWHGIILIKTWYIDKTALVFHNNQITIFPHKPSETWFLASKKSQPYLYLFGCVFQVSTMVFHWENTLQAATEQCLLMTKAPTRILKTFFPFSPHQNFSPFISSCLIKHNQSKLPLFLLWVMVWESDFHFSSSPELTQCQKRVFQYLLSPSTGTNFLWDRRKWRIKSSISTPCSASQDVVGSSSSPRRDQKNQLLWNSLYFISVFSCDDTMDSRGCRNKSWQRSSAVPEELEILSQHQDSSNAFPTLGNP